MLWAFSGQAVAFVGLTGKLDPHHTPVPQAGAPECAYGASIQGTVIQVSFRRRGKCTPRINLMQG